MKFPIPSKATIDLANSRTTLEAKFNTLASDVIVTKKDGTTYVQRKISYAGALARMKRNSNEKR